MSEHLTKLCISSEKGLVEISGSEEFVTKQLSQSKKLLDIREEIAEQDGIGISKREEAIQQLLKSAKEGSESSKELIKMALRLLEDVQERNQQNIEALARI